ncbi:ABC transporter permease subunit [Desulfovibrio sp. OttesenSCG-928-G15]|nr:ABC transporter permease subunit [Desulfovibrio sp. OttesenSCG-928-G15]
MKRPVYYHMLRAGMKIAALVLLAAMGLLLGFLAWRGLPAFGPGLFFGKVPPMEAVFHGRPVWEGLWPALVGSLCLVGLTMCLALFPGVGLGVYLAKYAGKRAGKIAGGAVDVLSGTPSIVMGLFGFTLIVFLRHNLAPDANTCLLLAAACLSLLVLPVLVSSTREALNAVPEDVRLTAASLGFSKAQSLLFLELPFAARGIWGGIILALGRAAEDTAVIMLTGVVANAGLPAGLADKFEALPFAVFYATAEYRSPDELEAGFGAALLLLLLSGGLVLLARYVGVHYLKRWQGGSA